MGAMNPQIPPHYLSNCLAMCLYFERPVEDGIGMVHDLGVSFARSCTRNAWIQSSGLVLARPELLKAPGNAKMGAFFRFKNSVRMRAFPDYAASLRWPPGKHRCAMAAFQPFSKLDGFSMHRCLMTYDGGAGWDSDGATHNPAPTLVVSMIPWGGTDSMAPGDLFDLTLRAAARYGRVCHGIIDHDIYMANQHGCYFDTSISPCTKERSDASDAWCTLGGTRRMRLCRHPREGLIFGRPMAEAIGIADPEGFARWRSTHGICDGSLTLELHKSGLFVLRCTEDPADFSQSVRRCERTQRVSDQVHDALCRDGFSLSEYAIHDENPVRLYDSILGRYAYWDPD